MSDKAPITRKARQKGQPLSDEWAEHKKQEGELEDRHAR